MKKYFIMTGFVVLYMAIFFINKNLLLSFARFMYSTDYEEIFRRICWKSGGWSIILFGFPLVIYWIIFKIRKKSIIEFCKFKKISMKQIIIITIIGISMSLFETHMTNLSFVLKYIPEFKKYISNVDSMYTVPALIAYIFIIPFSEEVIFRGLIFNEMRKVFPLIVVLIIHGILYLPFQPNYQVAIHAFINFTIFGLIYIFSGSLWASILVETVSAFGLFGSRIFGLEPMLEGLSDIYLGAVVIISAFIILFGTFKLKQKPLKEIFAIKKESVNILK